MFTTLVICISSVDDDVITLFLTIKHFVKEKLCIEEQDY